MQLRFIFRFYDGEGIAHTRRLPCMCQHCLRGNFAGCENVNYVGKFNRSVMRKKGRRMPKSRFVNDDEVEDESGNWVVEKVCGKRFVHGQAQYLLAWEGYDEMTWQYVDKLNCFELIEEYELGVEEDK